MLPARCRSNLSIGPDAPVDMRVRCVPGALGALWLSGFGSAGIGWHRLASAGNLVLAHKTGRQWHWLHNHYEKVLEARRTQQGLVRLHSVDGEGELGLCAGRKELPQHESGGSKQWECAAAAGPCAHVSQPQVTPGCRRHGSLRAVPGDVLQSLACNSRQIWLPHAT